jgi:WD40 repeat protein
VSDAISVSRDGTRVATILANEVTGGTKISLWSTKDGKKLEEFTALGREKTHLTNVYGLSVHTSTGKVVSVGREGRTILRQAATGVFDRRFDGHRSSVYAVAFSPDGSKIVTASKDNSLNVWDLTTSMPLRTLDDHNYTVRGVTWSPDGNKIASVGWDNSLRLWNATTAEVEQVVSDHSDLGT